MFKKTLVGLVLITVFSETGFAADWQYCLAPSHRERKVYISKPFPSGGVWGDPDSAFNRMLNQSGIRHDVVQCPRAGDKRSMEIMRNDAIGFNHIAGNEIINLDWKP